MQIGITTNANDLIDRWRSRGAAIDREQRRVTPEIAAVLQRESEGILRKKVYSVQIPRTRGGKPAWRRTGNLIASEKWKAEGFDVVGANTSDHAEYRLLLGTPYGRQIRSPGVVQLDWQVEAIKNRRSWIVQRRREAMATALRR